MKSKELFNVSAEKQKEQKKYTKPLVIASTKNGGNFGAGCQPKSGGVWAVSCRCDR